MANEALFKYGSEVTLSSSGAQINNAAFGSASNSLASASHSNYPLGDFALKSIGAGTSLASSGSFTVNLYRHPLNIQSTGDEDAPSSLLKAHYLGSFVFPNSMASTATVYCHLDNVPLINEQGFYLESALGTSLTAGWSLYCTPKTFIPST
jgi:hypothetical protein